MGAPLFKKSRVTVSGREGALRHVNSHTESVVTSTLTHAQNGPPRVHRATAADEPADTPFEFILSFATRHPRMLVARFLIRKQRSIVPVVSELPTAATARPVC